MAELVFIDDAVCGVFAHEFKLDESADKIIQQWETLRDCDEHSVPPKEVERIRLAAADVARKRGRWKDLWREFCALRVRFYKDFDGSPRIYARLLCDLFCEFPDILSRLPLEHWLVDPTPIESYESNLSFAANAHDTFVAKKQLDDKFLSNEIAHFQRILRGLCGEEPPQESAEEVLEYLRAASADSKPSRYLIRLLLRKSYSKFVLYINWFATQLWGMDCLHLKFDHAENLADYYRCFHRQFVEQRSKFEKRNVVNVNWLIYRSCLKFGYVQPEMFDVFCCRSSKAKIIEYEKVFLEVDASLSFRG